MGLIWRCVSAVLSRMIFVGHAVWALQETIYRIHVGDKDAAKNSVFWTLTILIGFIVLEGIYTMIIRKGLEYKFFWPTGFFYLAVVIPIVCVLEIFLLEEEIKCTESKMTSSNSTKELELIKFCNMVVHNNKDDQKLRSGVEIGMLGALVMGRWLLPRGELTRDQLSALLLNFISNGADVIEFLNTWNDFPILRNREVTYTVLGLYSWSLLQFAVVTTKTTDEYEANEEDEGAHTSILPSVFDINANDYETNEEIKKQIALIRPKTEYHTNLPRYIQKLAKKKRKESKSTRFQSLNRYRSRTFTTESNLSRKKTFSFTKQPKRVRPRTITFADETTDINDNVTPAVTTPAVTAPPPTTNKKSKIRFSEKTTDVKSVTAEHLQFLARMELWDEFTEVLEKAKQHGFTSSSHKENNTIEDEDTDEVFYPDQGYYSKLLSRFDQDIFQTVILLLSLELPYFCARVVFTVVYNVSSITMVFYTTKNVIMIVFLVYRLWVTLSGRTEDNELEDQSDQDVMTLK